MLWRMHVKRFNLVWAAMLVLALYGFSNLHADVVLYGKQLTVQELDQMLEREKQRRIAMNQTSEAAWNDQQMVIATKAQLVTQWANEVISDRIKAAYPEPTPEAVQQRIELYQAIGIIPSRYPIEVDVALRFGIEEILKVSDPTQADIDRVYEQVNRLVAAAGAPAVASSQWKMIVDIVRLDGPGAYPTYVTQEEFLAPLRKTVSSELRYAALAESAMRHFQITQEGRLYQKVKQAIDETGWTGKISVEEGVRIVVAVRETIRLRMTVMYDELRVDDPALRAEIDAQLKRDAPSAMGVSDDFMEMLRVMLTQSAPKVGRFQGVGGIGR